MYAPYCKGLKSTKESLLESKFFERLSLAVRISKTIYLSISKPYVGCNVVTEGRDGGEVVFSSFFLRFYFNDLVCAVRKNSYSADTEKKKKRRGRWKSSRENLFCAAPNSLKPTSSKWCYSC